jgi:hypothetical protein
MTGVDGESGPRSARVFLSYHRDDEPVWAHLVHESLMRRFGEENVFFDVSAIRYGANFRTEIAGELDRADSLIAIIGPRWLRTTEGASRPHDPEDWVRKEVEMALARSLFVVPVFVGGAKITESELPESMRGMLNFNGPNLAVGETLRPMMDTLLNEIARHVVDRTYRCTLAASLKTMLWHGDEPFTYGYLVLERETERIELRDEPARFPTVKENAMAAVSRISKDEPTFLELSLIETSFLGAKSAYERRYELTREGTKRERIQRFALLNSRVYELDAPIESARLVDRVSLDHTKIDKGTYSLPFVVELDKGWSATERLEVVRSPSGNRVSIRCFPLGPDTDAQAWAKQQAEHIADQLKLRQTSFGKTKLFGALKGGIPGFDIGFQNTDPEGEVTHLLCGVEGERGYTIRATLPLEDYGFSSLFSHARRRKPMNKP